ncbi:hypothetical protein BN1708_019432, partial [Verticillium longisporum]
RYPTSRLPGYPRQDCRPGQGPLDIRRRHCREDAAQHSHPDGGERSWQVGCHGCGRRCRRGPRIQQHFHHVALARELEDALRVHLQGF